ncbi:DUF3499 family protein [Kocuria palustris]|uniref:DUF3499 family protein n=1 Tax=Kocuria palustris TaxID=71999 RepID=UPI00119D9297|nr:DUF3499 family protein [Kocuria palustris]
MSTADAPLARLCSRQTCRRPAQTTLTFVYSDSTAVIGPLSVHAEPHAYDLCIPHAERMTPPRGWEIVRLEGVLEQADDDASAAAPSGPVADSAPLAPLSALPGAGSPGAAAAGSDEAPEGGSSAGGPDTGSPSGDEASEADAPGNSSGSAPSGWGRRRRGRLRSVTSPGAEPGSGESSGAASPSEDDGDSEDGTPSGGSGPEAAADGEAPQRPEQPSGGLGSLSDEIFAGEGTEFVQARARLDSQPRSMRRPHLRRGRG